MNVSIIRFFRIYSAAFRKEGTASIKGLKRID